MLPILYSFRRCPYAMRARLALAITHHEYELREISLKDKPANFLSLSPKGTVPVLQLPNRKLIEQSLDIMEWAFSHSDRERWLPPQPYLQKRMQDLIKMNDEDFIPHAYRYKYFEKYPEYDRDYYLEASQKFLKILDDSLSNQKFLLCQHPTMVDFAIFPFIRQFSIADKNWFATSPYSQLRSWLNGFVDSKLFDHIMVKADLWDEQNEPFIMSYDAYLNAA